MQLLDLQISDYTPILNKNQNSGQQRTKTKLKYTANKRHQLTIDMHLETVTSKRGKKWETSTSSCESLGGSDLLAEAAGEDFDAIAGRGADSNPSFHWGSGSGSESCSNRQCGDKQKKRKSTVKNIWEEDLAGRLETLRSRLSQILGRLLLFFFSFADFFNY